MTIREIKKEATNRFAVNRYQAMLAYSLVFAVALNLTVVAAMLCILASSLRPVVVLMLLWYVLVLALAIFVLYAPFQYSMAGFCLKSYRAQRVELSQVTDGFNKYNLERIILMHLLHFAIWLGLTLLLIVPGIIFSIRTSMSVYLLRANPKMKPLQALKASNKIMKGHCRKYFVMTLSFIGWGMLAVATLGAATVWVAPYFNTCKVVFYKRELQGDKGTYDDNAAYAPSEQSTNTGAYDDDLRSLIVDLTAQVASLESRFSDGSTVSFDETRTEPVNVKPKVTPVTQPVNETENESTDTPREETASQEEEQIAVVVVEPTREEHENTVKDEATQEESQPIVEAPPIAADENLANKDRADKSRAAYEDATRRAAEAKNEAALDAIRQRIEKLKAERENLVGARPKPPKPKATPITPVSKQEGTPVAEKPKVQAPVKNAKPIGNEQESIVIEPIVEEPKPVTVEPIVNNADNSGGAAGASPTGEGKRYDDEFGRQYIEVELDD